ncbi:hypothetical protein [Pseudoalteromonas peptidolytica]|uniref:hypothetical protein n=1 Tax=Pseudoalteromonas peptidolytica TaxID=61150 RepID=UPI0014558F15|nr:hypothetical protein [Pseudoalteromonas peptidolytica]NLR16589.1 hypothetical protein [Pseudoalteromonas peptidolytica]
MNMKVKHRVLICSKSDFIGEFSKVIDMPCLPTVGLTMRFGVGIKKVNSIIENLLFDEESSTFVAYSKIDIEDYSRKVGDYIPEDRFPIALVKHCGFSVESLNDKFEHIYTKLV